MDLVEWVGEPEHDDKLSQRCSATGRGRSQNNSSDADTSCQVKWGSRVQLELGMDGWDGGLGDGWGGQLQYLLIVQLLCSAACWGMMNHHIDGWDGGWGHVNF